jgi:hypothetical protein
MQEATCSNNAPARAAAAVLINRWIAAGHSDFADLLVD